MDKHYCPVCWKPVDATTGGNIMGHFDKNPIKKDTCPGSHNPFHIAIIEKTPEEDRNFGVYTPENSLEIPPKTRKKRRNIAFWVGKPT